MFIIIIDKIENKVISILNQSDNNLYSTNFYRTIENVSFENLIATCENDGCNYDVVITFVENEKNSN